VQSTQLIRLDTSFRWYDSNNSECLVKFGIAVGSRLDLLFQLIYARIAVIKISYSSTRMVVDRHGFRLNVGIILVSDRAQVFWGRRVGQDAWQFPQGGLAPEETAEQAMFRELYEEIGLSPEDVEILGCTKSWLHYRLPEQYIRYAVKPLVIGQKQKWFLLRLVKPDQKIRLDLGPSPEFDSWRWVDYGYPVDTVIYFKRHVYKQALKELAPLLKDELTRR
jgi:putative (di)nucleoside polyphosphate hydrolase